MRNLSSLWSTTTSLPPTCGTHSITAFTFDIDEDTLYVFSEETREAEVEVKVWCNPGGEATVLEPIASTKLPSVANAPVQIVTVAVLPDDRDLCLITRGGDITLVPLPPSPPLPSIVGTVEPGILSAALAPDASLFALVSAAPKPALILMHAPALTVFSENSLYTTDYGADQQVSAGWGAKTTQFHGSLGKQAAHASGPERSTTSPDDDGAPRIAWRGDAQFFAVSARENMRRVVRVYDRQGALQSTTEDVPGLEHVLAWRPSGALIAGTQRFGNVPGETGDWGLGLGRDGRHDVVFFERNGLRHGDFALREQRSSSSSSTRLWGYRVRELAWNGDSSVLAVWIERDAGDVVQLWTTGNYHWYMKFEISTPTRLTRLTWHAEDPARIALATAVSVQEIQFTRYTATSPLGPPQDTGLVAVVDGDHILLTPFRTQNVPPPMSAHRLALPMSCPPSHIAFSPTSPTSTDAMAVLFPGGIAAVWDIATPLRGSHVPRLIWYGEVCRGGRQLGVRGYPDDKCVLGVLCSGVDGMDMFCAVELHRGEVEATWNMRLPGSRGRLVDSGCGNAASAWTWQARDGGLWEVLSQEKDLRCIAHFPEFCSTATRVGTPAQFIGLTRATLHVAGEKSPLSTACTSYTVAGSYLVWTTTAPAHEAIFTLLSELTTSTVERRRIERGARIVVAVPSAMGVVLQMPRGNLETIMPRPLVLAQIREDVLSGEYGKAFGAARKHRVDLNILVETDPTRFAQSLSNVVTQLDNVEYFNLFLTALGRSTQPPETIAKLCDGFREELEQRDLRRYIHSILTAYVVKTPPDYEAALSLLLRLREEDPSLVEEAVKYIIFLVDAERLFDTALGMYDFSLVLLIAQHSQKDPREYLPFLRSLRVHEGAYQRFAIDDHLKRHAKALRSLRDAGAEHFEEAKAYVVQHRLYTEALALWPEDAQYRAMLELFGDYLFEKREFTQAALAFVQAICVRKGMVAYEKALDWQPLFDLAVREEISGDELIIMARRVADDLGSKRRHEEAARVLLDYADDVDEAVAALVRGGEWSEARRITALRTREDLVESIVIPGAVEACSLLSEEISEIDELRTKQVTRLDELSAKKLEEPDAFYGVEDPTLTNVDVMTDVSKPDTTFTRYTVAPSASSNRSRRTSRSKRKMDRKVGRKGTVEEEEYLLQSLTKLVARLNVALIEARALLPQLLILSVEHISEGRALQEDIGALEHTLRRDIERIWDERSVQPQSKEPTMSVGLTEKVPRPEVSDTSWRIVWITDAAR